MTSFLLLAFTFLIAGVIAVPLAARLGLGSVLGYLIAGIAISPILALLHVDIVQIQHIAEFGVVMMLFLVGLELEPKRLWSMRLRLLGLGGGQIVLSAAAVAWAANLLGQPWSISLAVGLIVALSSTAIVLQTLTEKGLLRSDGGQSSFSVLLMQDIAVIPMLALLPLLAIPELAVFLHAAGAGAADHGPSLSLVDDLSGGERALATCAAIAAVVLGGNYLTSPVFRFIAVANLRELFTAAALMWVIGIALLMTLVGVSPALGTFLAGVVLANSTYRHELQSDIDPFKGLLLGLFFMTVGAGINFALLYDKLFVTLGLTIGLIAIKAGILWVLGWVAGLRGSDHWLFTLSLAQAGEFGFVLLTFAVGSAVLPQDLADQLLLVVALSMLITPLLFILHDRVLAPRYAGTDVREPDDMPGGARIIIAGAGRVGGLVNRILSAADIEATVIDYSSARLTALERFGVKHYFGDATRPDLLHAAGIDEADVLVIAIDDRDRITELVEYMTHNHPKVHVVARAVDRDHVYDLWAMGCRDIIRETYDSTLRMGRSVYEALGIPRPTAQRMIDKFNENDAEAMLQTAAVHKVGVPPHENEDYIARVKAMRDEWEPAVRAQLAAIRESREHEAETKAQTETEAPEGDASPARPSETP